MCAGINLPRNCVGVSVLHVDRPCSGILCTMTGRQSPWVSSTVLPTPAFPCISSCRKRAITTRSMTVSHRTNARRFWSRRPQIQHLWQSNSIGLPISARPGPSRLERPSSAPGSCFRIPSLVDGASDAPGSCRVPRDDDVQQSSRLHRCGPSGSRGRPLRAFNLNETGRGAEFPRASNVRDTHLAAQESGPCSSVARLHSLG